MTNFMTPLEAQLSLGLALLIGLAIGDGVRARDQTAEPCVTQ